MFFFLNYNTGKTPDDFQLAVVDSPEVPAQPRDNTLYLYAGCQRLYQTALPGGQLVLLGDPVFEKGAGFSGLSNLENPDALSLDRLYAAVKGHYYWFYIQKNKVYCGASFGAIFPVYYHVAAGRTAVCSASFELAKRSGAAAGNKRNLLERLLFNYPLFDSTWWADIRLLEAHRYLRLESGKRTAVAGDFQISEYFGAPEDRSRQGLNRLADLFQNETELFFPETPFGVSWTGGFDGRTLAAAAKKAKREFFTYSFGRADSTDVSLPAAQAAKVGIPYRPIYLDEKYVDTEAFRSAQSFMALTEYNGNYGRPHYEYAARMLSAQTGFILTGNFGSELFRALHQPGVMMSEHLIRVFTSKDQSWKDGLRESARSWGADFSGLINPEGPGVRAQMPGGMFFESETEALIADLEQYLDKIRILDPNQRFYYFVYNELLRKYFGPELVMQSRYFNNRTPYLNFQFFKELNRTVWSGVHARLFEKMKSRRMKGQMFYATHLKRHCPEFYHLDTNKGYTPADVLESWRLPLIAAKVLWHKYLNYKDIDDNSVLAYFQKYYRRLAEDLPGALFSPPIASALSEIPAGRNIEFWIKYYSITAGWEAARTPANAAVAPSPNLVVFY
jgi:hypothetical protein